VSLELILVLLYALSIGSFSNVLILRIPKGQSIVTSSACPNCGTKLKPWHNIPLLSYFILRGECSECKTAISKQYPIVEFLSAVLGFLIYLKYGYSFQTLLLIPLFIVLLSLSIIDLRYRAVPDSLNLTVLTLSILYPLSINGVVSNFENALIFAGAFSLLRFYTSFLVGKEAMGEGDIMVAGTIGAILGVYLGTVAIFLSALISLPAHLITKNRELPFIPFLSMALLIVFIFEKEVISFLNSVYGY
jgi:leader peptidase (prepilin peptidase)/N-methyltransferase